MRAYTDRAPGVRLVTDPPIKRLVDKVLDGLPPEPPAVDITDDDFVPRGLRAWAGEIRNGIAVQGLVDGEGATYVTVAHAGRYQTLEVAREKALEVFEHPFAFGFEL